MAKMLVDWVLDVWYTFTIYHCVFGGIQMASFDLNREIAQIGSEVGDSVLRFLQKALLDPVQKYAIHMIEALQSYLEDLGNRIKAIPSEQLVAPSMRILGSVMEGLKYGLEEAHTKEMLTRLLLADMRADTKPSVLPAFAEIIKQLSGEDAQFFEEEKEIRAVYRVIWLQDHVELYKVYTTEVYTYDRTIHRMNKHTVVKALDEMVLENLARLNLLTVSDLAGDALSDADKEAVVGLLREANMLRYDQVVEHLKANRRKGLDVQGLAASAADGMGGLGDIPAEGLGIVKAGIVFTGFGERFLGVCGGRK
jgi:hypothetical protein